MTAENTRTDNVLSADTIPSGDGLESNTGAGETSCQPVNRDEEVPANDTENVPGGKDIIAQISDMLSANLAAQGIRVTPFKEFVEKDEYCCKSQR